nr:MAG TPA: LIGHT HARVESTING COMPLEX II, BACTERIOCHLOROPHYLL HARVESTING COMPLEX, BACTERIOCHLOROPHYLL, DEXTER [Caudoviricetes sp.]
MKSIVYKSSLISISAIITGCTQWLTFDASRLLIAFFISLIIGLIVLIWQAITKR